MQFSSLLTGVVTLAMATQGLAAPAPVTDASVEPRTWGLLDAIICAKLEYFWLGGKCYSKYDQCHKITQGIWEDDKCYSKQDYCRKKGKNWHVDYCYNQQEYNCIAAGNYYECGTNTCITAANKCKSVGGNWYSNSKQCDQYCGDQYSNRQAFSGFYTS